MFVFRPNDRPKSRPGRPLASPDSLEPRDLPALIVPLDPGGAATQAPTPIAQEQTTPLQVEAVQRRGLHAIPTRFTIIFNEALNPARASNRQNYLVIAEGPDLALGTADDVPVRLRSVSYQPGSQSVTLTTARAVPLVGREYVLAIDGNPATGVVSASGEPLNGNGGPGTDLFTIVNVDNFIPPAAVTRAIRTPSGKNRTPATGIVRNG